MKSYLKRYELTFQAVPESQIKVTRAPQNEAEYLRELFANFGNVQTESLAMLENYFEVL